LYVDSIALIYSMLLCTRMYADATIIAYTTKQIGRW